MSDKTTIHTIVRPKKVAVLVPYTISDADLRDVVEFLGCLWGGKYSCIIPFDISDPENEVGMNWLVWYSPDVVFCAVNSCNSDWGKRIVECISPFAILALRYPLLDNLRINVGNILPWDPVVSSYARDVNSLPDTTTKFNFISTSEDTKDRIFYDLSFGVRGKEAGEGLARHLRGSSQHVTGSCIEEFIKLHDNEKAPFTYLDVSGLELSNVNHSGRAPTIFVLARSILDYAWFWNNRASFLAGSNACIAIPEDALTDQYVVLALAEWLGGYHSGKATYCEIKALSFSKNAANTLARRLRPRVKKMGYQHVDVIVDDQGSIPRVQFEHKCREIDALWLDTFCFEFVAPEPDFVEEVAFNDVGCWVVDIDSGRYLKGHMPPHISNRINSILLNAPSPAAPSFPIADRWFKRYSYGDISISIGRKSLTRTVTLPDIEEILVPYLQSIGINRKKDEKKTCYNAAIELFGGLKPFTDCCNGARYEILKSLWKDVTLPCEQLREGLSKACPINSTNVAVPVSWGELCKRARLGKPDQSFQDKFPLLQYMSNGLMKRTAVQRWGQECGFRSRNTPKSFLAWLVEQKIVRQVFHCPPCPVCENKKSWVSRIDLEHSVFCSQCGNIIPLTAVSFDVEYQMNPLVQKAFAQEGVRPVALTLAVLKSASDNGFMYIPGFKGEYKGQGFDIDIIAVCGGELVLCECKNMEGVAPRAKSWAKIEAQLVDLIQKGKLSGARSVVLASLADQYPVSILRLAKKETTSDLRVVLLNKEILLQGVVKSQREGLGNSPAYFGEAFLPKSFRKKLKRKGERKIVYQGMTYTVGGN